MISPQNITQEEIRGLLEVLIMHRKLLDKLNPNQLGFVKRKAFTIYQNKINTLYEELDKK